MSESDKLPDAVIEWAKREGISIEQLQRLRREVAETEQLRKKYLTGPQPAPAHDPR